MVKIAFSIQDRVSQVISDLKKMKFELGTGPMSFIIFVFAFFGFFLIVPIFSIIYWAFTNKGDIIAATTSMFDFLAGQSPEDFLFKPFLDMLDDSTIWGGAFSLRLSGFETTLSAIFMWAIALIVVSIVIYYKYIQKRAKRPESFMGKWLGYTLFGLLAIVILIFITIFWSELRMVFVEPIKNDPNPRNWGTKFIIQGPDLGGLMNSLLVALSTATLSTVFGTFFAYIMARFRFKTKDFLRPLIVVPLIIPPFVSIIGFHSILGETGLVNIILDNLFNIRVVLGGSVGIVFVQFLHFYTLVYLNVYSSLVNIDPSLEESAENLGAEGFALTRTITLPLAMPGIAAGSVLAFILAIEDLGTPLIFGTLQTGDKFEYMPTLIFHNIINKSPNYERGYGIIGKYAALSAILVVIAVIGFILIRRFVSLKHYAMISKGRVGEPRTQDATTKQSLLFIAFIVLFLPIALIPHIGTMLFAFRWDGFLIFLILAGILVAILGTYTYYFKESDNKIIPSILLLLEAIVFILATLFSIDYYLSLDQDTPGLRTFLTFFNIGGSPSDVAKAFRSEIIVSITNMFLYSVVATLIIVAIATVLAYILARKKFPGKELLDTIVTLPLAIPGIIIGFGYFIMFYGSPLPILEIFSPENNPIPLLIMSYTVRKFTFTIRSAFAGMQQVDVQLEEASFNLGASRIRTIANITVPLIALSVFSGALISLVYCMSEVSTTIILLQYTFDPGRFGTASWKIWDIYNDPNVGLGYPMAAVLGVVLMLIQAAAIFVTNVVLKGRSEAITGI